MVFVEETDETVGDVVSRVMVTVEVTAERGPVTPFDCRIAPFCLNRGITVPSAVPEKHDDAVRVYVVPEPVTPNEHELAVPVLEKSSAATSVTATPNVTVNVYGPLLLVRVVVESKVGERTSTWPVTVAVAEDAPLNVPEYSTR